MMKKIIIIIVRIKGRLYKVIGRLRRLQLLYLDWSCNKKKVLKRNRKMKKIIVIIFGVELL